MGSCTGEQNEVGGEENHETPFKIVIVDSWVSHGCVATVTIQFTQYPRPYKHYYTNMPGSHTTIQSSCHGNKECTMTVNTAANGLWDTDIPFWHTTAQSHPQRLHIQTNALPDNPISHANLCWTIVLPCSQITSHGNTFAV